MASEESATRCSSWRMNRGTTSVPFRNLDSQTSATRPSIKAEVSTMWVEAFFFFPPLTIKSRSIRSSSDRFRMKMTAPRQANMRWVNSE